MSWQAYIDSSLLGSGVVSHAAILSNGDGSIWAKDDAFKVRALCVTSSLNMCVYMYIIYLAAA